MEIKSDPQYDTIQVIDLDIAFPGELQTHVVRPEDTLVNDGSGVLTLTFASGGEMVFNLNHAHWWAKRQRPLRVLAKETPHVEHERAPDAL